MISIIDKSKLYQLGRPSRFIKTTLGLLIVIGAVNTIFTLESFNGKRNEVREERYGHNPVEAFSLPSNKLHETPKLGKEDQDEPREASNLGSSQYHEKFDQFDFPVKQTPSRVVRSTGKSSPVRLYAKNWPETTGRTNDATSSESSQVEHDLLEGANLNTLIHPIDLKRGNRASHFDHNIKSSPTDIDPSENRYWMRRRQYNQVIDSPQMIATNTNTGLHFGLLDAAENRGDGISNLADDRYIESNPRLRPTIQFNQGGIDMNDHGPGNLVSLVNLEPSNIHSLGPVITGDQTVAREENWQDGASSMSNLDPKLSTPIHYDSPEVARASLEVESRAEKETDLGDYNIKPTFNIRNPVFLKQIADDSRDLSTAAGHYYKKKKYKKYKKKKIIKKKHKKIKKYKVKKYKVKKYKVVKKKSHHGHYGHHGGNGGHGHGKYYMYAKVPKKKTWEFGFKKGNKKHWIERHEKGHKNKFKTKVKWYDAKSKGKGIHVWDYNHHDKKHHG